MIVPLGQIAGLSQACIPNYENFNIYCQIELHNIQHSYQQDMKVLAGSYPCQQLTLLTCVFLVILVSVYYVKFKYISIIFRIVIWK